VHLRGILSIQAASAELATDLSGHRGELGNAQSPQKLRRKRWYEKILGGKKAGER
jgi:hypothetical protein